MGLDWVRRFQRSADRPAFLRAWSYDLRRQADCWWVPADRRMQLLEMAYAARWQASDLEC